MKYRKINNSGLGVCHVLKETKFGYLIYSESNKEHFFVTKEIENERFYCNVYFSSLDNALNYINSLEK